MVWYGMVWYGMVWMYVPVIALVPSKNHVKFHSNLEITLTSFKELSQIPRAEPTKHRKLARTFPYIQIQINLTGIHTVPCKVSISSRW